MASYNFKFQRLLNYKEDMEGLKKSEFGQVHQKLNIEEAKLSNYYLYKENLLLEKNNSSNSTSIGTLKLFNNYLQDVSKTIEKQEEIIEETKEELEKVKEELILAMTEKKTYEALKENQYNEFMLEEKKKEEKLIDGIVSFINTTQK